MDDLEGMLYEEMKLDKELTGAERRAFPYAYRSLLRGQLADTERDASIAARHVIYASLGGVVAGSTIGAIVTAVVEHVLSK